MEVPVANSELFGHKKYREKNIGKVQATQNT
jgi:hypothetical protein